jgi:NAD(P)H-hydrate epimerase
MGRSKETQQTVLSFMQKVSVPAVIDADAIHALSKNAGAISKKTFLITPHTYEFFILTGREIYKLSYEEKAKAVREEAKRLGVTILLKGRTDIISDGENIAFNKTGGPFLAVGGTGDTLAGIAGAIMARGVSPFEAGQAAAYLNGLAGEIAGKKFGDSLMATDLINSIVEALKF